MKHEAEKVRARPGIEKLEQVYGWGRREGRDAPNIVLPTHGLPYAIALDLDGVLWPDTWPEIGPVDREMVRAIGKVQHLGVQIVFWTCRERNLLDRAIWKCQDAGLVPTRGMVNVTPIERVQHFGSAPSKISADWYVDDRSVGYTRNGTLAWLAELAETLEHEKL